MKIVSPANGAVVIGGFSVDVEASDPEGVLRVDLAIDGTVVGTDDTAPYTFATEPGLAPGMHTISATAYDTANQGVDTIAVTVSRRASRTPSAATARPASRARVSRATRSTMTRPAAGVRARQTRAPR